MQTYVVFESKEDGRKSKWIEVGAIWPQKKGEGFDLVVAKGITVTRRIVCMQKAQDVTAQQARDAARPDAARSRASRKCQTPRSADDKASSTTKAKQ